MPSASPATFALLGLLTKRSWTGYELTQQVRRSLRFVWPVSEGHLYREQQRIEANGWASVELEPAGGRSRKRYTITEDGRRALTEWLSSEPEEPHLQIEGILRMFHSEAGDADDLRRSMETTAGAARAMLDELVAIADEYLEAGGPLSMLEARATGPQEFHGRPVFPERLHGVALALDATTALLETVERVFAGFDPVHAGDVPGETREALERVVSRGLGRA